MIVNSSLIDDAPLTPDDKDYNVFYFVFTTEYYEKKNLPIMGGNEFKGAEFIGKCKIKDINNAPVLSMFTENPRFEHRNKNHASPNICFDGTHYHPMHEGDVRVGSFIIVLNKLCYIMTNYNDASIGTGVSFKAMPTKEIVASLSEKSREFNKKFYPQIQKHFDETKEEFWKNFEINEKMEKEKGLKEVKDKKEAEKEKEKKLKEMDDIFD